MSRLLVTMSDCTWRLAMLIRVFLPVGITAMLKTAPALGAPALALAMTVHLPHAVFSSSQFPPHGQVVMYDHKHLVFWFVQDISLEQCPLDSHESLQTSCVQSDRWHLGTTECQA